MKKVSLRIQTIKDGEAVSFPIGRVQAVVGTYTYNAKRMSTAPSISASFYYPVCLDGLWTGREFVEFEGTRYYAFRIPTSSKDETTTLYKHEVTFVAERAILENVFFFDVYIDKTAISKEYPITPLKDKNGYWLFGTDDVALTTEYVEVVFNSDASTEITIDEKYKNRYRSSYTSFSFVGKIEEFVYRLNDSLVYSGLQHIVEQDGKLYRKGFQIVIDEGVESDDVQVTFEDCYFLDALAKVFEEYKLPYYWVGGVCHVGNAQYVVEDPLEYGDGLLGITISDSNNAVFDRITGVGSSENIPYYYPNENVGGTALFETEKVPHNYVSIEVDKVLAYNSANAYNDEYTLCRHSPSSYFLVPFPYVHDKDKHDDYNIVGNYDKVTFESLAQYDGREPLPKSWCWYHKDCIYYEDLVWFTLEPGDLVNVENASIETWYEWDIILRDKICFKGTTRDGFSLTKITDAIHGGDYISTADKVFHYYTEEQSSSPKLNENSYNDHVTAYFTIDRKEELSSFNRISKEAEVITSGEYVLRLVVEYSYTVFPGETYQYTPGGMRRYDVCKCLISLFNKKSGNIRIKRPNRGEEYFYKYGSGTVDYSKSGISIVDIGSAKAEENQYTLKSFQLVYPGVTAPTYIRYYIESQVSGSDDAAKIRITGRNYTQPCSNLMPSVYFDSEGSERFYDATNDSYEKEFNGSTYDYSDFYKDDNGKFLQFVNPYKEGSPHEGKQDFSDIKPTIKGVKNADGELLGEILDVAFDTDDNDLFKDGSSDTYQHGYFYVKLHIYNGDYGFNLFKQATENDDAKIVMTSGDCSTCEFQIVADKKQEGSIYNFINRVSTDEDGNLLQVRKSSDSGYVGDYISSNTYVERQQNTSNNEVWIACLKDTSTFGVIMPNSINNFRPHKGDRFVITGIKLPTPLIRSAEVELSKALIKYMKENNAVTSNVSVKLPRTWLSRYPSIARRINENSCVSIVYDGKTYHNLFVTDYTCKADDNILYEVSVELSATLSTQDSQSTQQSNVDGTIVSNVVGVEDNGGLLTEKNIEKLKSALQDEFLSRTKEDVASQPITFECGIAVQGELNMDGKIQSSDYEEGNKGFVMRTLPNGNSYIEADELKIRKNTTFDTVDIQTLQYSGGNQLYSAAGGTISRVENILSDDGRKAAFRCYFRKSHDGMEIENMWCVGDMAMCKTYNLHGSMSTQGNWYYWRLVTATGEEEVEGEKYTYIELSNYLPYADTSLGSDPESRYSYLLDADGKRIKNSDGEDVKYNLGYDTGGGDCDPREGDKVVQFGNIYDTTRQNAMINIISGDDAPAIMQYVSVGQTWKVDGNKFPSYSLDGRMVAKLSPNGNVMTSSYFSLQTSDGGVEPIMTDRGEWNSDTTYHYYERVSYDGQLWLCKSEDGTKSVPSEGSTAWVLQVKKGTSTLDVMLYTLSGNIIKNGEGTVTICAKVMEGSTDVTSQVSRFVWTRESSDASSDEKWNSTIGSVNNQSTLTVDAADVNGRAMFNCKIEI